MSQNTRTLVFSTPGAMFPLRREAVEVEKTAPGTLELASTDNPRFAVLRIDDATLDFTSRMIDEEATV